MRRRNRNVWVRVYVIGRLGVLPVYSPKLRGAFEGTGNWKIQIVKRSDSSDGFKVTPQRWIVGRTFAWLDRCRRLAKINRNQPRVLRLGNTSRISELSREESQYIAKKT